MKTSELTGPALDWAVAKCEGFKPHAAASLVIMESYTPSTNWAQGGPIIEREKLSLAAPNPIDNTWCAMTNMYPVSGHKANGPTTLVAAMRCYVASKLGDEVEIPEELE